MSKTKRPKALVFCIADDPVFEAMLTVCRDVAASGRGLRSADDYRRWWFVVRAYAYKQQLVLPPDAPGLDDERLIPGFVGAIGELLDWLGDLQKFATPSGSRWLYCVASHSRLTEEPLQDFVRERGFDVWRPHDLLARDPPAWPNFDAFDYEEKITRALASERLVLSPDDRLAFSYVLGELDELPQQLAPGEVFFKTLPNLPHPSDWIPHEHRVFDVLCRARAFERISFDDFETGWSAAIHARARELSRRGASPLEAFRGVLGRERSFAENLELVAASARLRSASVGDPIVLEREIDAAKRSISACVRDLVFDDLGTEPEIDVRSGEGEDDEGGDDESGPVPRRPDEIRQVLERGTYQLRAAWVHDDLLIAVSHPSFALRSTDAGNTWSAVELPVDKPDVIDGSQLHDGRVLIVAAGEHGAAFSWDRGETWASSCTGADLCAVAVAPDGRVCVVGHSVWGVSDDPAELRVHEDPLGFEGMIFDGERFLAVCTDGSVLTLEQQSWRRLATSVGAPPEALAAREGLMMVLTAESVATSEDNGQRWTSITLDRLGPVHAAAIARDGTRYLVAGQVLTSKDGERWQVMSVGDNHDACDIALGERSIVITSSRSITLVGPDSSAALGFGTEHFAECPEHYAVAGHAYVPASLPAANQITALFAAGDRAVLGIKDELLVSEDRGRSWVSAVAPLRLNKVTSIVEHGGDLWAACDGVMRSSDGGHSWVVVDAPLVDRLLPTADGQLFAARENLLLRRDPEARSGWQVCLRFRRWIKALVSDDSGAIYVAADDEFEISHDSGRSWDSSWVDGSIRGFALTADGLLACTENNLHVSRDQGWWYESHPLPLHVISNGLGCVHQFCGSARGDLYFSSDHFLLHSSDRGRTLSRVRTPFLNGPRAQCVIELWGRQYMLLEQHGLLERVDATEVPETRFIEVNRSHPRR